MTNFRSTQFRIDSHEVLPGNRVKIKAILTKAGVFDYLRGQESVKERRPESEVFATDSLATLEGAYVTIDHPSDGNAKANAIGRVLSVQTEPPYVKGVLQVEDERAAKMIENGHIKEISCGYAMVLERSDNDEADFVQTQIRYDHAALGPEGWGRLGPDVCLRLDSNGNETWADPMQRLTQTMKRADRLREIKAHLARPILARDLDTSGYPRHDGYEPPPDPKSSLRKKLGVGPAPTNLRERIFGTN